MVGDNVLKSIDEMRSMLGALSGTLAAGSAWGEADLWLEELRDRFFRPYSPWVAAICGPTGAGKSHLVNVLAGGQVSLSSYRRPSTAAPVAVAQPEILADLAAPGFLPGYEKTPAPEGALFSHDSSGVDRLYLAPVKTPDWSWPGDLVVIDTPDFDSVRLENQRQALDMSRRADVVILVAHQAKYADQSAWEFLLAEAARQRPLLLILNRVTATAAVDDFKDRLKAAQISAQVLPWPEEVAVGQVAIKAARDQLTGWLLSLGGQGRALTRASGRRAAAGLAQLIRAELMPPLRRREGELATALAAVGHVTDEWLVAPQDRVALNLPGETKESLIKGLSEMVGKSDLWAKPRRWLALPFEAAEFGVKRLFGKDVNAPTAEKKMADNLAQAGREALVSAVRGQARALAEAAGLPLPQPELDFSPEEIRTKYEALISRMDIWLKAEMERLLAGLPLGQKAMFYFVQAMHLGLVAGLVVQTGGLPGTETLVGGALGPVISKLTGALISRDNLADFEVRASECHQQELRAIFQEQGQRYQRRLESELAKLEVGKSLEAHLKVIETEAGRLWD